MLAIALLLALTAVPDSTRSTVIKLSCAATRARAGDYFEEHTFYSRDTDGQNRPLTDAQNALVVDVGTRKGATTPRGSSLKLDRFSIHKYVLPQHPFLMRAYDFNVKGRLSLAEVDSASCKVDLHFEVSAFSYVWALGVIDDGERIEFHSNGVLERMYLSGLAADLTSRALLSEMPSTYP